VITDLENFTALDPFFRIIEKGLDGLVDGPHFFDLLDEGVIVDYVISVPGYPRRVVGRDAVAELYRNYRASGIVLHSADGLAVHRDREASVVVLEYATHGRVAGTGRVYDNPLHFGDHDQGPQGHALAGLPRPGCGLRCHRVAVTALVTPAQAGEVGTRLGEASATDLRRHGIAERDTVDAQTPAVA
jgi:hypothetical protein